MPKFCLILSFIASLFWFPSIAEAGRLRIDLSSKEIAQGDVFAITVRGSRMKQPPVASFRGMAIPFSSCGRKCFIGFGPADVSMEPGTYEIEVKTEKENRIIALDVVKAGFPVVRFSLQQEKVILGAEDLARARGEEAVLNEIFSGISERKWNGEFIYPSENDILMSFGVLRIMNGSWESVHKGVDIAGQEGDEVRASNDAIVVLASELFFGGNTVILDHGQGIYTIYMHLSRFLVKAGDQVSRGEMIGCVGSSGRSSGPHLHFGAVVSSARVNPVSLIELDCL